MSFLLHAILEQEIEYEGYVQHPEMMILTVLSGIATKYDKGYCYPSQKKIRELLLRCGRNMSLRALNRHLNQLVRLGYIERKRRHTDDAVHGRVFRSSLYKLKGRAYKWLLGMAPVIKRASLFKRPVRVPNSAQYSYTRRIIPESPPKSGGAPPGSLSKCFADDPGEMEEKRKAVAEANLMKIRTILHV